MNWQEILSKLIRGYPVSKEFIDPNYPEFIQKIGGFEFTIIITGLSLILSIIIGFLFAVIRETKLDSKSKLLNFAWLIFPMIVSTFVTVIRGLPILILISLVFFLPYPLFKIELPMFLRSLIALTIYSTAYMCEIFRSGFRAVHPENIETAKSLGLSQWQIFRYIKLPIAIRTMLPAFTGLAITVLKDSSVLSIVGVSELTRTAKEIDTAQPASYFGLLFMVIVLYWLATGILTGALYLLERKFGLAKPPLIPA